MALSPFYNWSEPDNSSLVKNGASDIRTLGDAIDTSVWNVGFGQAGKNKIINGDFRINQRAFTSVTANSTYTFDRFMTLVQGDGTSTFTPQTFTAGTAPVAGYEATNFLRIVTTGQTAANAATGIRQRIEDVRTLAGQTATVSFWAKASTGTPKVGIVLQQAFGSGGSPSSAVYSVGTSATISTSWVRYSATISVPSISGKTLGTNNDSYLAAILSTSVAAGESAYYGTVGIQSATIDIWGVQVEYGSKATPFQTATGTLQGELLACRRYYKRTTSTSTFQIVTQLGFAAGTSGAILTVDSTPMRVKPTSVDYANVSLYDYFNSPVALTSLIINGYASDNLQIVEAGTSSGLTQYRPYYLITTTTGGYLGVSAEL